MTEPTDADRALVAREIARLKAAAGPAPSGFLGYATPEHMFYTGWVDILTELDVTAAATRVRDSAIQALAGRKLPGVMEAAPRRGGWLEKLDDSIRRRNAIRQLNRERVRLRLPKLAEPGDMLDEDTARNLTGRTDRDDW